MISVPMSYVSGICGLNPYKHIGEQTFIILKRYNSGVVRTLADAHEWPLLRDFEQNHKEFFETYMTAPVIGHLEYKAQKIIKSLCSKHSISYNAHRFMLLKRRGYVFEKTIRDLYADKNNVECRKAPRATIFIDKHLQIHHEPIPDPVIRLIGSADALSSDGEVLEIKCRKYGFRKLYHETIQLAIYCLAYKRDGRLIEYSEGKLNQRTISQKEAKQVWHKLEKPLRQWLGLARAMRDD